MITLLVCGLFLSLVVSGLCAIGEAAFYSYPESAIEKLKAKGHWTAPYISAIKGNMERTIASLLLFDTVADTLGVWLSSKAIEGRFSTWVETGLIGILAILILVFGELVPKTLGVQKARQAAPYLAVPFHIIFRILEFTGLVWLSLQLTRRFSKGDDNEFHAEDIHGLAEMGLREGSLDNQQAEVIRNMLALKHTTVRKLMTPRQVVFALPSNTTVLGSIREKGHWPFSRVPVYSEPKNHWIGVVMQKDAYRALADGKGDMPLQKIMRPLDYVPDSAKVDLLLRRFLRERKHLMGVVDEYGTVAGIITLEDVLEGILGREIVDEFDQNVDQQEAARRQSVALAAINLRKEKPQAPGQ